MRDVLRDIRNGKFAQEWAREQDRGYPNLKKLAQRAAEHAINKTDRKVQKLSASSLNFSTSR